MLENMRTKTALGFQCKAKRRCIASIISRINAKSEDKFFSISSKKFGHELSLWTHLFT